MNERETTMTVIETELLESLDFEFVPECEHHQHDVDKAVHSDGPFSWYEHPAVLPCGLRTSGVYICQGWKDYMDSVTVARCSGCDEVHSKITQYSPAF